MPELPKTAQEAYEKKQHIQEAAIKLEAVIRAIEAQPQARATIQNAYDYGENVKTVISASKALLNEYATVLQTMLDATPIEWPKAG